VASMVAFRNGRPDRANYRRFRITTVEGQDDFASMAEVVGRRYRRLVDEKRALPDLIMVDGGKGQLSSAVRELQALGLAGQPVIGLAKQREEIFRPFSPHPIVLPAESGALRMLQRIRDEAHRFANGYHQLLMKKRMTESVLDECPGVSQAKKKALLQHFGSVDRMRKAAAGDFQVVPGVGEKLAVELEGFFARLAHKPVSALGARRAENGDVVYTLRAGDKL